MYSAIIQGGQRLEVERATRPVELFELALVAGAAEVSLRPETRCPWGTYVRVPAEEWCVRSASRDLSRRCGA
jgi:tRNA U55 pseudouridine synthase TruB